MCKLLLFCLLMAHLGWSQTNTNQLGYLDIPALHNTEMNDIWGYTDELGNEYALCGTHDGVSIVDITNNGALNEVYWIADSNSTWRDVKTYGDYAYITTEAQAGLLILDLTALPNANGITATHFFGPAGNQWHSAHNLYVDEGGFLYIFGVDRGVGGVIVYDLNSSPLTPTEVLDINDWYAHDGFVQNDTGYFGNINIGQFSVWDIADKSNPLLISTSITPTTFTHNVWAGTNGFAYTTDEIAGGFIGAYDLTNPAVPVLVDKIRSSAGDNIIPHNTHVNGNLLFTSYYADGVVIHDISRPNNMVEVGQFDTSPIHSSDFVGCWGVYPFFNSGKIIASDIEEGLFVIGTNLPLGGYLEGNITEQGTGSPVGNVDVTIDGQNINDLSNIFGDYATGIAAEGLMDVSFFKIFYYPQTLSVNFLEGVVNIQDVVLEKIPQYSITLRILDLQTNLPIENAIVSLEHTFVEHEGITDANGEVTLDIYYQDVYQIHAGKWGNITSCFTDSLITSSTGLIEMYLDEGIYDDFTFDFGWDTINTGDKGGWVREIPIGVFNNNSEEHDFKETTWDCGKYAFITGNGSSIATQDQVENGESILLSPIMDLSGYTTPHINYKIWYFNRFGPNPPNDTLYIYMNNGIDQVLIDFYDPETTTMGQWLNNSVSLIDKMMVTSTMQLIVYISDYPETVNITKAAFDYFYVTDFSVLSYDDMEEKEISIYPNPFTDQLFISETNSNLMIFDFSGQLVFESVNETAINLSHLSKGIYLVMVKDENGLLLNVEKVVKR